MIHKPALWHLMLAVMVMAPPFLGGRSPGQDQRYGSVTPADTPDLHLARAHEALASQRLQEAEREYRAALALDPRLTVRARFPLAVVLFGLGKWKEARREFEAVRSETSDNPNLNYYLGRLDLMEGNVDSAIHNLTIAAAHPPFPNTDYYLGSAYLKKGDLDSAEEWLRKAAALAPRDASVETRLGNLYLARGRKEEAEKAFARSAELRHEDIAATEQGLECSRSLETQSIEQARAVCQKLFDPNDEGKLVTLGLLYGQQHDYLDAVEPFRLAADLDPDAYDTQFNLGLTYFRLKRYAEARVPLEKAAALRPDVFEVVAPLGAVLYVLGDDAAAYPVLDHANRLNPENSDVSALLVKVATNLAAESMAKADTARACQYLLRAAEARPDDPEPHRRLAEIYESSGQHADAQRERQQAERLRPQ